MPAFITFGRVLFAVLFIYTGATKLFAIQATADMISSKVAIPEVIAHYSPLDYTAGDVLSLGTVAGVAGFREDAQDYYLKPGDVMECEIEGIGVLRNPVISWEEAHGVPAPPAERRRRAHALALGPGADRVRG